MTAISRISRRSALTAALVATLALASGTAAAQTGTVTLVVDYGDGATKTIAGIPWRQGTTVLDVMNAAKAHPHGITFAYRGSGATALLTKIDDVANQGGGAGRKNWQLWVNNAYAERGFGVYGLQAQDIVSWRFGAPDQGK